MIEVQNLTKTYGPKTAVDNVSFAVEPGRVTGFLGPNGAGKSTTMRMIMGLSRPSSGRVHIDDRPLREHRAPMTVAGALLDPRTTHPGRSARNHLRALAASHHIPRRRVDEVLGLTGLEAVADRRVGGFSLGMGQRLGIAAAILGQPRTLVLDEVVNGLDPDGVLWVRELLRSLAQNGCAVLLSSHLMSEMAQTADHILVIGRGRILADTPLTDFIGADGVRIRTPQRPRLAAELSRRADVRIEIDEYDPMAFTARGITADKVGELALNSGITLHHLTPITRSLEEEYMRLTASAVEYRSAPEGAHR